MEEPTIAHPGSERQLRGRDYLRELAASTAEEYRERPVSGRASQVFRAAAAGGLSVAELQRSTALGRQTIYNLLASQRGGQSPRARPEALALVAAHGSATSDSLAELLGLSAEDAAHLLEAMAGDGLLVRSSFVGPQGETTIYYLDAGGDQALAEAALQMERRRAHDDAWFVYFRVRVEEEIRAFQISAEAVCGEGAQVLETIVCSAMEGPELALAVRAADQREALLIASEVFGEIRERADLRPAVPMIAEVLAPSSSPR